MNRELIVKLTRTLNWVIAGLMLLLLITFAFPYFNYDGKSISIWGYLGFPSNFEQLEDILGVRFLTIKELNVVIGLVVVGIICIISLLKKKGLGTQLFPLIWCVWGIAGYLSNSFLLQGNTFARYLQMAIIFITAIVVLFNIVLHIQELRTRPKEEFMDLDAWSADPGM